MIRILNVSLILMQKLHRQQKQGANMVVSEEDVKAVNRSSIALADGSGYLATLEVFHQLHCLCVGFVPVSEKHAADDGLSRDYIRQYISKDYYITPETEQRRFEHMGKFIPFSFTWRSCCGAMDDLTCRPLAKTTVSIPSAWVSCAIAIYPW